MAPSTIFSDRQQITANLPADDMSKLSIVPKPDLVSALSDAKARFLERNPKSLRLHEEATKSLPGGNTRSLLHTTPFPISLKSGAGYQVIDEDGHTYIDFVAEMTAALYGHSHPVIVSAIQSTIAEVGLNLGATTSAEATYASLLCSRFSLDKIRFTNSGTEATMHALAGARKFTGKRKIVVFANGYHGAVFMFGGGRVAENNVDHADWIIASYNDIASAERAIRSEGVAAILVEGMQGSGGVIPGTREFLHAVQKTAKEAGVVFILDEVMTSRFSPGGITEIHGLQPDLKTFGKYLGSGMAFGAFGGRKEIMAMYDPRNANSLMHSGTFNNNTLVMRCGYVGLSQVYTPQVAIEFNRLGTWMRERLNEVVKGTRVSFTGVGTIIGVHITEDGTTTILKAEDVKEDSELKDLFWMEMTEAGFWYQRRGFIALILGTPKSEIERFIAAVEAFLEKYNHLVRL